MERSAIIVAGGIGKRMGASMPKQFMLLNGKPLLGWTIKAFRRSDPSMGLVVVLPEAHIPIWKTLCIGHHFDIEHTVVAGGEERFHSTLLGLRSITHGGLVAVHDGVRPLVSTKLISRCFLAAKKYGTAIPVVPISPSVREVNGLESRPIDRTELRLVQTPQCFKVDILRRAFEIPYDPSFTDEATLVERSGTKVHLVEGEESNIKVTTPLDLRIAEALFE